MKAIVVALAAVSILMNVSSASAESVATLAKKVSKVQKTVNALSVRAAIPGPQGPAGAQGPQGPAGASAFNPIPSGTLVAGVFGDTLIGSGIFQTFVSLPAPAPMPLTDATVVVRAVGPFLNQCNAGYCLAEQEQSNQYLCNGKASAPDPSPGVLCIYPTVLQIDGTLISQSLGAGAIAHGDGTTSKLGFVIEFSSSGSEYVQMAGVWAYRAP